MFQEITIVFCVSAHGHINTTHDLGSDWYLQEIAIIHTFAWKLPLEFGTWALTGSPWTFAWDTIHKNHDSIMIRVIII